MITLKFGLAHHRDMDSNRLTKRKADLQVETIRDCDLRAVINTLIITISDQQVNSVIHWLKS